MSDIHPSTSLPRSWDTELDREDRIELAHTAWLDAGGPKNKTLSITKAAKQHGVSKSTLVDRINGAQSYSISREYQKRLTSGEEAALLAWILRLQAWGWPPRVEQVRSMANELLLAKGDTNDIGINWPQKFMKRHTEIKTAYIPPLDKERAMAQDPTILSGWFDLYLQLKTEFEVDERDIYNMDEKGFMQGVIAKLRVMIPKYEKKKAYMTQCGNREWVSLIECVSLDGRLLPPWIIFKGKQLQKAWKEALKEGEIAMSENGWTDNTIGLAWIQRCFDKETRIYQKGEFRMLLVDGHASHITTAAIQYCIDQKIILLCLPPHTTHLLQPLDVGVFAPLATAYKSHVQRITRLGASYHVDKVDFLQVYQQARQEAITPINVKKAWAATGLSPFDPEVVLQHFPSTQQSQQSQQYNVEICPTTPPEATITYVGPDGGFQVALTPANTAQIQQILQKITQGVVPTQKPVLTQALEKVGKAAIRAMAESTIQSITNSELVELNQRKKQKSTRAKGNYGTARFMNQAVLDERKVTQATKEWNTTITSLLRLGPDIFAPKPRPTPRKKNLPAPLRPAIVTPNRSPIGASATAIPSRQSPTAVPVPQATPSRQARATAPPVRRLRKVARTAAKRPQKLIVKLPIRVTTAELNQGLQGQQARSQQGQEGHITGRISQSGRVIRTRKARKACI